MGIRVTTPAPVKVTVKSGTNQVVHSATSFVGALGDPGAVQRSGDTMTGELVLLANTTTSNVVPRTDQTYDLDRKSTRLNSSHIPLSRMPSSA